MGSGVALGKNKPVHWLYSTAIPNSLKDGTSGKAANLPSPECANALNLPPLICCTTVEGPLAVVSTSPAKTANTAGPAPV